MHGKDAIKKITAHTALAMIASTFTGLMLAPSSFAQFGEMLTSPSQGQGGGQGTRTLRNPLIQGAPTAQAMQSPTQGQPPPVGHGSSPRPVVRGDSGQPQGVYSGRSDSTHGNIFPTRNGQQTDEPGPYVRDAGRRTTSNGQQQGMYEYGRGQQNGTGMGPGGSNNGTGTFNNGGPASDASGMGWGGASDGTGMINNGGQAPGATASGPGGPSYGTGTTNNGGAASDATGRGWGGASSGTGMINNGGQAPGATASGPGGPSNGRGTTNNGGAASDATGMGWGGASSGTGMINNGGQAPGATASGPGGPSNGTGTTNNGGAASDAAGMGWGGPSSGTGMVNNGGAAPNATGVGPGGSSNGTGITNNGGPAQNAQGTEEQLFTRQRQQNKYDFTGPLPTVRTFSRYLVILGVVAATVFMGMAAWGMVMGAPYAGSRVIGAAAGLLLLLAGYTIWKIVQMNTFNFNSTGVESRYRDGTRQQVGQPGGQAPNPPFTGPAPPPVQQPAANNPQGGMPFPQPPGSPFAPATAPGGP